MRWKGRRQSSNIQDRRNSPATGAGGLGRGRGGMLRLLPLAIKFLGFKGTVIAALGVGAFLHFSGADLGSLLGGLSNTTMQNSQRTGQPLRQSAQEQELVEFVSVVLADTEQTWHSLFELTGDAYQEPQLVLYRDAVKSACGLGQSAMGPFYCPGDQKVYLDLGFFDDLAERHDAPGDFAQAYVIAHEVGHHVQTLLGISARVQQAKRGLGKVEANELSVRQELQADCFAGIWGHHASRSRQLLERGDIDEGLNAASAIGDDRLQKQSRGTVSPESFTHGSSAQRVRWFKRGLQEGQIVACNTFKSGVL